MPIQKLPAAWADEVIRFWFEELRDEDWFKRDAALDERIRSRFGELHSALRAHPPEPAGLDAKTLLAAVLVFDQFSRNLFRDSATTYATDAHALELARHAVATGLDRQLEDRQRYFIYMPFMHSEDRAMQAESARLFKTIPGDGGQWAEHHRAIVDRFGRFPHRNALLGRASTAEELEFLAREPSFA